VTYKTKDGKTIRSVGLSQAVVEDGKIRSGFGLSRVIEGDEAVLKELFMKAIA
jgi:hypothetical protein